MTDPDGAAREAFTPLANPEPDSGEPSSPTSRTPSGLPLRVPQASLPPTEALTSEEPDPGRTPDRVRNIVGSYRAGTARGRTAASWRTSDDTQPGSPSDETSPEP